MPQCSDFNVMLYVVLPAAVALVMVAVILGVCCLRQTHKKPLSVAASSPRCDSFKEFSSILLLPVQCRIFYSPHFISISNINKQNRIVQDNLSKRVFPSLLKIFLIFEPSSV